MNNRALFFSGLPCVSFLKAFVNVCMLISRLVLKAICDIRFNQFLIIAFTFPVDSTEKSFTISYLVEDLK